MQNLYVLRYFVYFEPNLYVYGLKYLVNKFCRFRFFFLTKKLA